NEFKTLSTPDWPYLRLLRALSDNTQFEDVEKEDATGALTQEGGLVDQIKERVQRRVEGRLQLKLKGVLPDGKGERYDAIPDKFKWMVRFGVNAPQAKPKEGEAPKPPEPTHLSGYVGKLESLAGEMGNIEDGPPHTDTKKATEKFEEAVRTTQELLLKM